MDILGMITGFLSGGWGNVIAALLGGGISLLIFNEVRKFVSEIREQVVRKIKAEISNLENPHLREVARHVVRYVASLMPDAPGNEKFDFAVKKFQEITPDILISDEKVKVLIESTVSEFKKDLSRI